MLKTARTGCVADIPPTLYRHRVFPYTPHWSLLSQRRSTLRIQYTLWVMPVRQVMSAGCPAARVSAAPLRVPPFCSAANSHLQAEPGLEIFELLPELRERRRARLLLLLRARRAQNGKQQGLRIVAHRAADASHRRLLGLQAGFAARIAAARAPEATVSPTGALSAALGSSAGPALWRALGSSRAGPKAWRAVGSSAGPALWRAVGTSGTSAALALVGRKLILAALEMHLNC